MPVPGKKDECCGCSVCISVCPAKAISMETDREGFYYPAIDNEKCTNCGLCEKFCAFKSFSKKPSSIDTVYVAKHKDVDTRMKSRSGGVFSAVSEWILSDGGSVYGCVLDEKLKAVHIRAVDTSTRDQMCKSKYVQSDMTGIIDMVISDLQNGKKVLFSGTGCQVDAVISVCNSMKIDCSSLFTMDIICHGCVSPKIYSDYIAWLESKYRGKVSSFDFRDKTARGWDGHIESYVINGKKHKSTIYREIFYTNLCLRPSCYNCKYAVVERNSDITIADAWGIKKAAPAFNDNRGVSMFIVQSENGKKLLEVIREKCEVLNLPLEEMMQGNLKSPSRAKGNREEFWNEYYEKGIVGIIKKYGKEPSVKKIKNFFKYKARQVLQSDKYYLP